MSLQTVKYVDAKETLVLKSFGRLYIEFDKRYLELSADNYASTSCTIYILHFLGAVRRQQLHGWQPSPICYPTYHW